MATPRSVGSTDVRTLSREQRRYLDAICEVFQGSPEDSREERLANELLVEACLRLGLDDSDVFSEWSSRVFLPRDDREEA
jgi:hypothetical protein